MRARFVPPLPVDAGANETVNPMLQEQDSNSEAGDSPEDVERETLIRQMCETLLASDTSDDGSGDGSGGRSPDGSGDGSPDGSGDGSPYGSGDGSPDVTGDGCLDSPSNGSPDGSGYGSGDSVTSRPSSTRSTTCRLPEAPRSLRVYDSDFILLERALLTLYDDQIIPAAFNLRGRLREFGCSSTVKNNFMALYSMFPSLYRIEWVPSQGDQCVFFVNDPPNAKGWIDANDATDPYPATMWAEFSTFLYEKFFQAGVPNGVGGGRYGLSKYLKQLNLPFFKNFSLGRISHVVQLAISQKYLLAYEDNVLKPVSACAVFANALLGLPDEKRRGKKCITDIREIQVCIQHLLQLHPEGFTLSTLKRKLKAIYGRELCQTVFHCAKLIDLMFLPEIRKVCRVAKDSRHIKVLPLEQDKCIYSLSNAVAVSKPLLPPPWTGPAGGMNGRPACGGDAVRSSPAVNAHECYMTRKETNGLSCPRMESYRPQRLLWSRNEVLYDGHFSVGSVPVGQIM
ncbi:ost-hth associated domain protein [Cystoisospora suis]|uniref:Ost-hth associated domain protein n=1 Tax=Cystoisospora suis TaxID=483139 RepID=A0A2C6KJX5_9APIC|nr:ost-hth associated domain protein [Cystoisospora suis]